MAAPAGARVHGYALDPPTEPSLFESARVGAVLASDTRADLADREQLAATLRRVQPEVVFHLAAQPLVRASYADPLGTLIRMKRACSVSTAPWPARRSTGGRAGRWRWRWRRPRPGIRPGFRAPM